MQIRGKKERKKERKEGKHHYNSLWPYPIMEVL
jgi:hypothetical protein